MSANDPSANPKPCPRQQAWLKIIGMVVLLLGLAGAGAVYWMGTHPAQPTEDELLPGNARAETHRMQLLYGKMGLLTMELSDDLKQPGTQAFLIAMVSILIAAGCFYMGLYGDTLTLTHAGQQYLVSCDDQAFAVYRLVSQCHVPPGRPGWPVCLVTNEAVLDETSPPPLPEDDFSSGLSLMEWLELVDSKYASA